MRFNFQKLKSPIGLLYLVGRDEKLCGILFEQNWAKLKGNFTPIDERDSPTLQATRTQLTEYFQGSRRTFDLPYELEGTDFQRRVWNALAHIPFGTTKTYKEQALSIDAPQACRAVGRTNGLNPLCVVLPCHRVVGSNGALTGYAGGMNVKKFLLELEGTVLTDLTISKQTLVL